MLGESEFREGMSADEAITLDGGGGLARLRRLIRKRSFMSMSNSVDQRDSAFVLGR